MFDVGQLEAAPRGRTAAEYPRVDRETGGIGIDADEPVVLRIERSGARRRELGLDEAEEQFLLAVVAGP